MDAARSDHMSKTIPLAQLIDVTGGASDASRNIQTLAATNQNLFLAVSPATAEDKRRYLKLAGCGMDGC
jgi:hypothetical protein